MRWSFLEQCELLFIYHNKKTTYFYEERKSLSVFTVWCIFLYPNASSEDEFPLQFRGKLSLALMHDFLFVSFVFQRLIENCNKFMNLHVTRVISLETLNIHILKIMKRKGKKKKKCLLTFQYFYIKQISSRVNICIDIEGSTTEGDRVVLQHV